MIHPIFSLVALLLATPSLAEESVRFTLDGTPVYKSEGAHVQMDSIAWGFFSHLHTEFGHSADASASHAAHSFAGLGIKPNDPAATIIARYTREASLLNEARLQKWPVADDDRNRLNAQWTGLQAERRGLLFASMIIELDNIAFDVGLLKEHLERAVRPSISAVSVGARRLPELIEAKERFDLAFITALDRAGVAW